MTSNKPTQKKTTTRINKYLKDVGLATRGGADELVEQGLVTINGVVAALGQYVRPGDKVEIVGNVLPSFVYYAYHKPEGIVTIGKAKGEREIKDIAKFPVHVFPLGRLDKDSSGLMLMTNDGRVTDRLLNPNFSHEKEYEVTVNKTITNTLLRGIKEGALIGKNERARPAKIRKVDEKTFHIILTEGKNREIRRMCSAFGFTVKRLVRFRVENVLLRALPKNGFRPLAPHERAEFLERLGIKE